MALATASNLATAVDKGLIARPSGVSGIMNSMFVSTATKASNMLVAAASVAVATGERWRPMSTVRYLVMLTIWANVWVLRIITDIFPPSPAVLSLLDFGVEGLIDKKQPSSTATLLHEGSGDGLGAHSTAIGRALSHILVILNDLQSTSRKYEFVLATADRILAENVQLGHAELLEVNRAVLASAFSRTSELLRRTLQRSSSITATWPARVLSLLPLGPRLAALYDGLRLCLGGLLPPAAALQQYKPQRQMAAAGPAASVNEWLEAEKLAHELLWITNKLRACSAIGEAIARWAFASGLASLSLTAHPRVQGPIVKITVMLLRELARGEWEAAREVRFGILALWLPVLCYASQGVTSPVLTGMEKWEMEKVMEDLVAGLPFEDQEIILRNWLEDFSASDTDWPNLTRSFDPGGAAARASFFAEPSIL